MSENPGYVSADYLRKAADMLAHVKRRTYELMRLVPGSRALDIGCGPGIDTVPLAEWVGEGGTVVGVDTDPDMLAQADSRAREAGVSARVVHRQADAMKLPFDDGAFDASRAERLFQVLPPSVDPERVLAEITRVTRAGGWVVVADADWGAASLDVDDSALERRLAQFFAERLRPNGYAGRRLYRWFRRAGLQDIEVELFPIVHMHSSRTHYGDWLQREALAAGIMTPAEAHEWRAALARADEAGEFYASGCMVVAAGRLP